MDLRRTLIPSLLTAAILLLGQTQAVVDASADFSELGSLTVVMKNGQGESLEGAGLSVFRVAEIKTTNGQLTYSLVNEFDAAGIVINNTMTSEENKAAAAALIKYIPSDQIASKCVLVNSEGKAVISGLSPGLYLVVQSVSITGYYDITPFLVFLPSLDPDGITWNDNLIISPKGELEIDREPTLSPTPATDTGTLNQNREPTPRANGGSKDKDTLSAVRLPQTGMLLWPVALLAASGILIFCLGWADVHSKRKKDE